MANKLKKTRNKKTQEGKHNKETTKSQTKIIISHRIMRVGKRRT